MEEERSYWKIRRWKVRDKTKTEGNTGSRKQVRPPRREVGMRKGSLGTPAMPQTPDEAVPVRGGGQRALEECLRKTKTKSGKDQERNSGISMCLNMPRVLVFLQNLRVESN